MSSAPNRKRKREDASGRDKLMSIPLDRARVIHRKSTPQPRRRKKKKTASPGLSSKANDLSHSSKLDRSKSISRRRELLMLTPSGQGAQGRNYQCNCKNSKCLKLYCECFASGVYCDPDRCHCLNCCNCEEQESVRSAAIAATLEKNPHAFRPKVAQSPYFDYAGRGGGPVYGAAGKHNKGCHCKKSGCLKKYCECFQAEIFCSDRCKCQDCKNFKGSEIWENVISRRATSDATTKLSSTPTSKEKDAASRTFSFKRRRVLLLRGLKSKEDGGALMMTGGLGVTSSTSAGNSRRSKKSRRGSAQKKTSPVTKSISSRWNALKGLIDQSAVEQLCVQLCDAAEETLLADLLERRKSKAGEEKKTDHTVRSSPVSRATPVPTHANASIEDDGGDFLRCAEDTAVSPRVNLRVMGGAHTVYAKQEAAVLTALNAYLIGLATAADENIRATASGSGLK
eukprot:g1718.t1